MKLWGQWGCFHTRAVWSALNGPEFVSWDSPLCLGKCENSGPPENVALGLLANKTLVQFAYSGKYERTIQRTEERKLNQREEVTCSFLSVCVTTAACCSLLAAIRFEHQSKNTNHINLVFVVFVVNKPAWIFPFLVLAIWWAGFSSSTCFFPSWSVLVSAFVTAWRYSLVCF